MSDHSQESLEETHQFAQTEEEAAAQFKKYKSHDPFPDIPPALLNSADIEVYVAETGMIFPFHPNKLKSASYEISLQGDCISWDEKGEKCIIPLKNESDTFTLKPNSIAFVTHEPTFRLPDYIALRFNLRITNVHRGLLLGTGPLVDPGFEGKLLIPMHNLTTNEYMFKGGEGLIWVEFTKLSPNKRWNINWDRSHWGEYIQFPNDKKYLAAEQYLAKASPHRPIRSSIPDAIQISQHSAEESAKGAETSAKSAKDMADKVESLRHQLTVGGIITALLLVIGIAALVIQVYMIFQDSTSYVRQSSQLLDNKIERIQSLEREVQDLKNKLESLAKSSVRSIAPSSSSSKSIKPRNERSSK